MQLKLECFQSNGLQNSWKMVKCYFISILFLGLLNGRECMASDLTDLRKRVSWKEEIPVDSTSLKFSLSFDKDTIQLGDSLGVCMTFINTTEVVSHFILILGLR